MAPASRFDQDRLGVFHDPGNPGLGPDANFDRWCARSREWTDYRLMLRTAREMGMEVMVVCQPINANYTRLQGISDPVRAGFYRRLGDETAAFGVPLLIFPAQGEDAHYFHDADHPSALMWLVYDRALDAFYHQPTRQRP